MPQYAASLPYPTHAVSRGKLSKSPSTGQISAIGQRPAGSVSRGFSFSIFGGVGKECFKNSEAPLEVSHARDQLFGDI